MTDTETARRIMATGVVDWREGMLATNESGRESWRITVVDFDHVGGVQAGDACPKTWGLEGLDCYGSMVGEESSWLPDLNDGPTCDAMEEQVVAAILEVDSQAAIEITHLLGANGRVTDWKVESPGLCEWSGVCGSRSAALLAACKWLKGVRDA